MNSTSIKAEFSRDKHGAIEGARVVLGYGEATLLASVHRGVHGLGVHVMEEPRERAVSLGFQTPLGTPRLGVSLRGDPWIDDTAWYADKGNVAQCRETALLLTRAFIFRKWRSPPFTRFNPLNPVEYVDWDDALLGEHTVRAVSTEKREASLTLPEGTYTCDVSLVTMELTRPRLGRFAKRLAKYAVQVEISPRHGVPVPDGDAYLLSRTSPYNTDSVDTAMEWYKENLTFVRDGWLPPVKVRPTRQANPADPDAVCTWDSYDYTTGKWNPWWPMRPSEVPEGVVVCPYDESWKWLIGAGIMSTLLAGAVVRGRMQAAQAR